MNVMSIDKLTCAIVYYYNNQIEFSKGELQFHVESCDSDFDLCIGRDTVYRYFVIFCRRYSCGERGDDTANSEIFSYVDSEQRTAFLSESFAFSGAHTFFFAGLDMSILLSPRYLFNILRFHRCPRVHEM